MDDQISSQDFIAAVKDIKNGKLVEYAIQNKSKKSSFMFKSILKQLSIEEIDNMWDDLSKVVINQVDTIIIGTTKRSPNKSKAISPSKKACLEVSNIIQAAIDLAAVILDQRMPVSQGLLHMVVFLNRIIFELPSSLDNLKNSIALLCEKIFHFDYLDQDHELVTFNAFLYLMQRSLAQKHMKKDVKRVFALRSLIPKVISMKEEVDVNEVFNLYKKCVTSSLYLSMLEGQKIIKLILAINNEYVSQIHEAIKRNLSSATLAQGSAYGKAYFNAWALAVKTKNEELQKDLEICFQDFITMAVNGRRKALVAVVRKILAQFNSQKKDIRVSKLLYISYQPILWRSLRHPDGLIRANSARLFLDVFPLEDPEVKLVAVDQELNEQLLLIKDLLIDEYPIVRSTAVIGLCIAMSVNWELFPEDILKTYFTIIVNDLSCDSSSTDVRCAVAKGFKVLLENPLTLPTMQVILPRLKPLFHDISDPVRIAFCQLLLRVKKISAIKYFNIVPIEHLLARMEEDSVISKLIVNLVYNSYFPKDESPDGWLTRCIEMIKADRGASRVFFQYAPGFIGLDTTAQFMIHAVKSIDFYTMSYNQFVEKATTKKELDYLNENMEILKDVGFHDPDVVSGLLDAVSIMWLSSLHSLEKPENKSLLKLIVGKIAKPLGKLPHFYQNTSVWNSIYYLSSFMPTELVPNLASLCFFKLKDLDSSADPHDYMTLLECLCNHNQVAGLIMLFKEWIEAGFQLPADKPPAAKKRKSKKSIQPMEPRFDKHLLAAYLLNAVLDHRSCQKAILRKHAEVLKDMLSFTDDLKRKVELSRENNSCHNEG
ncbi:Condensin-2 complex subunit G2 like protein [Argiope bruennichi]|uniref:Condensin-2 complex subunit G2 like protein n=1 Tax=Argiope bruennichi TaxID=94029 RepID=A0A8T0FY72_ARGBR|nr:Condensin-2 complex subunit G2 like protein [Argiope bruennichi]